MKNVLSLIWWETNEVTVLLRGKVPIYIKKTWLFWFRPAAVLQFNITEECERLHMLANNTQFSKDMLLKRN